MRKILTISRAAVILLGGFLFFAFQAMAEETSEAKYHLTKQWETGKVLKVPESVLYYEPENMLYVSNIDGTPLEKDGKGFISKITPEGKIESLNWATGLNAPKGATIFNGKFYVSDIDVLAEIDLGTGKVLNRYRAPGAIFLNDVAADTVGNIYVTDYSSQNSAIYRLTNNKMEVWVKGPEINMPNGLNMEPDRLVVGNCGDGTIKAVSLVDKKIQTIVKVGSPIDGLRPDGNGNYFVSDWKGTTSLARPSGEITVLLNTSNMGINAADLEYIISKKLLLIPTFFGNRVVAYRFE